MMTEEYYDYTEDEEHPLDASDTLEKWGFNESKCHYCGIHNSDLDGLLMQCGKCKKV